MEGRSVPGQSFRRACERRGDGNLALKNGRISTGIPEGLGAREYSRWKEKQQQWHRGGKGQMRLGTEWKQAHKLGLTVFGRARVCSKTIWLAN